ncbi:MAG: hypothetical protein HC913_20430 [Microscillaceae bacterium]|nr:hypothetical protein [Microscillaceae bacterium]
MRKYTFLLPCFVFGAWLALLPALTWAQPGKNAVFGTDRDGDGIPDTGGQDKCPTTLSQIEGRRATTVDEYSGQEITIRLPKVLKDFVFQDRIPLDEAKKQLLNEQGVQKRELKRVEEKYGKYADMKASERKVKADELTVVIADFQARIDSIAEATRQLDPNSYIEFVAISPTRKVKSFFSNRSK